MVGSGSKTAWLSVVVLFFLCAFSFNTYAQQAKCNLVGRVVDENNFPVAYASVAVYVSMTPVAGTMSDENGEFALKLLQSSESMRLVVEFMGYHKSEKSFVPNLSRFDIGTILLKEDAISLGEVVVTAKETAQKSSVEHTVINASSNLASSKGTAFDILRSSSSVTVSNEVVSIRGNSNILILIDGIPTTASDLSTIPAANIKSIEVITNPDASYDSGGTGGIINIVSKKISGDGFSGLIAANYGFNHYVTGNMAFSYVRPKVAWRLSYNTKYEDDIINTTLDRKVKGSGYELYQQMQAAKYTFNTNIALGADFKINSRNRLNVDFKFILPRLNTEQSLKNSIVESGSQRYEQRYNDVTWNRENLETSVVYSHTIRPEVSDITVKGSVSKIWGHRPSYYFVDGHPVNKSVSGGSPFLPSLQADYKHKYKCGTLSAGAKLTYRSNDIYHQFYEKGSGGWHSVPALSSDLLHTETIPAIYAMFSSGEAKRFSYKVGLRGEFSHVTLKSRRENADGSNNSFFLAPTLSGIYRISEKQEFSAALSRRIGRPTYPQLNPYMSMVDATTYEQGNMNLKPEKSTKIDLSYSIKGAKFNLFANGYVNYTEDYISQITMLEENMLITTYTNADSDLKAGLDLSLRVSPAKWLEFSIAANTYYGIAKGSFEGADIDNWGWTNNSNVSLDIVPWKGGNIQIQYFVTTPQFFPQLTTSFTNWLDAGIKQRLLKGRMVLSLMVTDIMDSAKWEVSSDNGLFELYNSSKGKSRMLWLGISYNFNSFRQKGTQKSESDRSLIKLGL